MQLFESSTVDFMNAAHLNACGKQAENSGLRIGQWISTALQIPNLVLSINVHASVQGSFVGSFAGTTIAVGFR